MTTTNKKRANKRSPLRGLLSRLLGVLLILAILAGLGAGGWWVYGQVRALFKTESGVQTGVVVGTQDVAVTRGNISTSIRAYGTVRATRDLSLGFQLARGEVTAVNVKAGDSVKKGQALIELDIVALEGAVAEARAALLEAQNALNSLVGSTGVSPRLKAEVTLRSAESTLLEARRALAEYDAGTGTLAASRVKAATDLSDAQAALALLRDGTERSAQIERLQWIYNLAEVKHGPYVLIQNPSEKDRDTAWLLRNDMLDKAQALKVAEQQYRIDLQAAEQKVITAQRALAALDQQIASGGEALARQKLVVAVESAEAAVKRAAAQLAAVDQATVDVSLVTAQTEVLKAEWTLADAEAALAESKLVAPFDGTIDAVSVVRGAVVSSSVGLVTMLDPTSLYGLLRISDVDVSYIKAGQPVEITFDAVRTAQAVQGTLGEIPLFGTSSGGLTYFEVPVSFNAGRLSLRVGMTLNCKIVIGGVQNALLVPMIAVQTDQAGAYVNVVQGERVARRAVSTGANDGVSIEITEGLQEGEIVRAPLQSPVR
jgi:RND family efflux transporter MFP subunit